MLDNLTPAERTAMECGFDLVETPTRGWEWRFENKAIRSACCDFATAYDAATHALDWIPMLEKLSRRESLPQT